MGQNFVRTLSMSSGDTYGPNDTRLLGVFRTDATFGVFGAAILGLGITAHTAASIALDATAIASSNGFAIAPKIKNALGRIYY